jgi:hypothetical protein
MPRDDKVTMKLRQFNVIDDFLDNPDEHLEDIFSKEFYDVDTEVGVFKGIQPRLDDEVQKKLLWFLRNEYEVAHNFVRISPEGQIEPNFIHSDEMMGDLTAILYLSSENIPNDGTTIYNDDKSLKVRFFSDFNRMIIFDSELLHSRNIFSNFGVGKSSRLIQVLFLNRKKWQQQQQ